MVGFMVGNPSSRVRIRGNGTINNSDPLYIVDGMPIGGGLDFVNPNDIESIEVLKDAACGAYEDNEVGYKAFTSNFSTDNLVITLDFPSCAAGTTIEVKGIIIQKR